MYYPICPKCGSKDMKLVANTPSGLAVVMKNAIVHAPRKFQRPFLKCGNCGFEDKDGGHIGRKLPVISVK